MSQPGNGGGGGGGGVGNGGHHSNGNGGGVSATAAPVAQQMEEVRLDVEGEETTEGDGGRWVGGWVGGLGWVRWVG